MEVAQEGLIFTLRPAGSELAVAIVTTGEKLPLTSSEIVDEIPDNLYETLLGTKGYNEAQIAHYFVFLVENSKSAKASRY